MNKMKISAKNCLALLGALILPALFTPDILIGADTDKLLLDAAAKGDRSAARRLIKQGADLECRNAAGMTPLMVAVANGHLQMTGMFIAKRAAVNAVDRNGWTALVHAASAGRKEIVLVLLHNRATGGADSRPGRLAMSEAVKNGHEDVVEAIKGFRSKRERERSKPAGISRQKELKDDGFFEAARVGDARMVKALIEQGRNINEKQPNGRTALHEAAACGQSEIVQILLENKAWPYPNTKFFPSPLFLASDGGHAHVVDILLRRAKSLGPNDRYDGGDDTALSRAAGKGHEDVVRILVNYGADLNARTKSGATALIRAAAGGYNAIVRYLIDYGADPATQTDEGTTALQAARRAGHADTGRLLEVEVARGRRLPQDAPVLGAIVRGDIGAVRRFLDDGHSVNSAFVMGPSLLHMAVAQKQPALVAFLLSRGADPNVVAWRGTTPLMAAAETGDRKAAELLLKHEAEVNAQDMDGRTALLLAVLRGHVEVAELLLNCGADADIRDAQGLGPREAAGNSANQAMERLFISRSAGQ